MVCCYAVEVYSTDWNGELTTRNRLFQVFRAVALLKLHEASEGKCLT
jgi:hypothetical protein